MLFGILFTKYSFIIFLELLNSLIRKRMFCHLLDYLIWNCRNICTCKCTVCHMDRIADGCCDNLGLISINIKNFRNLADQFDSRLADII